MNVTSPETVAQIRAMLSEGKTHNQIMAALNTSSKTIAKYSDLSVLPPILMTDEKIEQIRAMRREGKTQKQIASALKH